MDMNSENFFLPATQSNYKLFWDIKQEAVWLFKNPDKKTLVLIGQGIKKQDKLKYVLEEYILTQMGLNRDKNNLQLLV